MAPLSGRYSLKMQRCTLWHSPSAGGSKLIWTDQQSYALLDVLGTILGPEIDFSPYLWCQKTLIQRFYTPSADTFCSDLGRMYCWNVIHFLPHFFQPFQSNLIIIQCSVVVSFVYVCTGTCMCESTLSMNCQEQRNCFWFNGYCAWLCVCSAVVVCPSIASAVAGKLSQSNINSHIHRLTHTNTRIAPWPCSIRWAVS